MASNKTLMRFNLYRVPKERHPSRAEQMRYIADCYLGNTFEADATRAHRKFRQGMGCGPSGIRLTKDARARKTGDVRNHMRASQDVAA